MLNLLLLSVALSTLPPASQLVLEFDGTDSETALFAITGPSEFVSEAALIRSGKASLRVSFAPPERWPGIRVHKPALVQKGWQRLVVDVQNPQSEAQALWIRLDDELSTNGEDHVHRRKFQLAPGWSVLTLELESLDTPSGRRLDPEKLQRLILHQNIPKERVDLIFDHLRFEGSLEPTAPKKDSKEQIRDWIKTWNGARDYPQKKAALQALTREMDAAWVEVLDRKLLDEEEDARAVEDALVALGKVRTPEGIAAMLEIGRTTEGARRWRWIDVLGRTGHPSATAWLAALAGTSTSNLDLTAAIMALTRSGTPDHLSLFVSSLPGSWQLKVARVAALRRLGLGPAFPALIDYLTDDSARVREDAHAGLVALSGRDVGQNQELWRAWWTAEEERRRNSAEAGAAVKPPLHQSAYGSYYGLPLSPGRLCFVVDVSGSMKEPLRGSALDYTQKAAHLKGKEIVTRLDLARAELVHAVEAVPEGAYLQLIWYESEVFVWSREGARKATRDNKAELIIRVNNLRPGGSTNIHGALSAAFTAQRRGDFKANYRDSVDTIYFLSDGDPSAGDIIEVPHLVADIREQNRIRRIKIHTIGMGTPGSPLLRDLARFSAGTFVDLAARQ